MLLRFGTTLPRLVATLFAVVAVSMFLSASPAQHPAKLHMVAALSADVSHSHGHSHDDGEILADDAGSPEHHHADHSHEKADLVTNLILSARHDALATYFFMPSSLEGSGPDGIDRPPRAPVNIA